MSKKGTSVATPIGVKFDPDRSLTENAEAAWEAQLDLDRRRACHNARIQARRIFKTDEFEVSYPLKDAERIPVFSVEDFLVAYWDGELGLVEFCSECGEEWTLHRFGSIALFGRAIEKFRSEDDEYVCRLCSILRGSKR